MNMDPKLAMLVDAVFDETLDDDGWSQLDSILTADAAARGYYLDRLALHAALMWTETDEQQTDAAKLTSSEDAAPSVALAVDEDSWWQARWETVRYIASNYTVLSLVVSGLFFAILFLSMAQIIPDWKQFVPGNDLKTPSVEFVAHLTRFEQTAWDKASDGNLMNRDLFVGDKLILKEGLIVITYDSGAQVVLEGPATYQIQSSNGGDLSHGKLVARIHTKKSQGFAVQLPHAHIVDLGTEFGVEVATDGAAEVAVLQGEVEVIGDDGGETQQRVRLTSGQGVLIAASGAGITHRDKADGRLVATMRSRLKTIDRKPILVTATAKNHEDNDSTTTNAISNFTVAPGSDRKLVLVASWESSDTSISAIWNETESFTTAINSEGGRNSAILYLDNPTVATADIVVTFGKSTESLVGVVNLVNAADGVGIMATATGHSGSLTTTDTASFVVGVYTTNDSHNKITSPFSSTIYGGDAGSCRGNAGYQMEAVSGLKNYTWTVANPQSDNHVFAGFVDATGETENKEETN